MQDLETDSDREFLSRLKESVAEKPKPKHNKNWLWAIPSGAVVCAAVLVGTLVPLLGGGDIRYDDANFVWVDSDLQEISRVLTNLTIHISENPVIKRTFDSISGDNLFYTLFIEESSDNTSYSIEVKIIVNDKYEFDDFNVTDAFVTKIYPNYSVSYDQQITAIDSDINLNLVQCNAKINNAKYDIYVTKYDEYAIGNGTFLTVIDNMFEFS